MRGLAAYQNVQVLTADRVRIVVMLYDGILRFNKCAQKAIADNDVEARTYNINRSVAIISELFSSLNQSEGGEIAQNLARLYDFSLAKLYDANRNNDPACIESVNRVVAELKAGWEHVAGERAAAEPVEAASSASNV